MSTPKAVAPDEHALTERLAAAVAAPASNDEFDPHLELRSLLAPIGLGPEDAGGAVEFVGADPIVPSTLRLGGAASLSLVAKSVAIAKLWQMRGGAGQDIAMDLRVAPHRLCPFYDQRWELVNGAPLPGPTTPTDAFGASFYETADGRWTMPLNTYPGLRAAGLQFLGIPNDRVAAALAIRQWTGTDLEAAGSAAGIVMPLVRSTSEILLEPQYLDHLAHTPLIEIEKIGDSEPEPFSTGPTSPLADVRALGMGHVIAGAAVGRTLALHGADVLNLWRPAEFETDVVYYSANVGVRSATVDPRDAGGAALTRSLLADADVFYANRRPGYLENIGLGAEEAAHIRPGIIHATASLHGRTGPWSDRIGFDQTAGCVTGMMLLEGGGTPALPPIMVVNDYLTAWLLATGVVTALMMRATEGGSWRVHVSLTRAAMWILSMGVFDREYAAAIAGSDENHAYRDPETFVADTSAGHYQGVTDQVRMSRTPGAYREVLVPRGSSTPSWLPR